VALIQVDAVGETTIAVAPGANASLAPVDLPPHDAVLCQLEVPDAAVLAAWEECTGLFCLNAAPARRIDVDAVDGTAAGDAFTACLLVSLLEARPEDDALTRACAAGALAASRFGAQPSLPTAAEVDALLGSDARR
jgi:ribokinase